MSGEELRELRQAAELSQHALAARLGVARVSVARWETGRRPIARMTELAVRHVLGTQHAGPAPRPRQGVARHAHTPGRSHRNGQADHPPQLVPQ